MDPKCNHTYVRERHREFSDIHARESDEKTELREIQLPRAKEW